MAEYDCKHSLDNLKSYYIAKFGNVVGLDVFCDIIQYHYLQDITIFNKYQPIKKLY